MGKMLFLNDKGHTAIAWDEKKAESVKEARQTFNDFLAQGFIPFEVQAGGAPAKQIDAFDPTIKEIGFVKQFVGG